MQSPSGFRLEGGRAVDVEPLAALFANAYMWPQLVHMILAAYLVVGFLLAGAYAWSWLRGGRSRYVRVALTVALTAVALAAPAQIVVGDWIARQVTESQPTKLAAFEGLGETQEGAPIHIGGWYDEGSGEVEYGIPIPRRTSSRPSPGSRWSRRSGCWEASGSPCRGWWPRSGPARTPEAQASRSCSAQSSVKVGGAEAAPEQRSAARTDAGRPLRSDGVRRRAPPRPRSSIDAS